MAQPTVGSVHVPGQVRVSRLRNLRYKRIDLVDNGASQDARTGEGAHVLLYKRADDMMTEMEYDALPSAEKFRIYDELVGKGLIAE